MLGIISHSGSKVNRLDNPDNPVSNMKNVNKCEVFVMFGSLRQPPR